MPYKSGKCYVCNKTLPVDSHHVHPLEYGGRREGRQVNLCQTDHGLLHKEAETYHSTGKFQNLSVTYPKETQAGQRMRSLIKALLSAKTRFESGVEGSNAGEQRFGTQVQWDDPRHLRLAHTVKKARGFTNLSRFIQSLVFEEAQRLQRKGKL